MLNCTGHFVKDTDNPFMGELVKDSYFHYEPSRIQKQPSKFIQIILEEA